MSNIVTANATTQFCFFSWSSSGNQLWPKRLALMINVKHEWALTVLCAASVVFFCWSRFSPIFIISNGKWAYLYILWNTNQSGNRFSKCSNSRRWPNSPPLCTTLRLWRLRSHCWGNEWRRRRRGGTVVMFIDLWVWWERYCRATA